MVIKIKDKNLKPPTRNPQAPYCGHQEWIKFAKFAVNPRGALTHRVRSVETILYGETPHHGCIDYWCSNGCNFELRQAEEILVDDPPKDRLLCVLCDAKAIQQGQRSADEIAKRHVHKGVMRPHQVCCQGKSKSKKK